MNIKYIIIHYTMNVQITKDDLIKRLEKYKTYNKCGALLESIETRLKDDNADLQSINESLVRVHWNCNFPKEGGKRVPKRKPVASKKPTNKPSTKPKSKPSKPKSSTSKKSSTKSKK